MVAFQTQTELLDKFMLFSDKVLQMRVLQRKRERDGRLSEAELTNLHRLYDEVDSFHMLPIIPRAVAQ
jgi:hypothetical protein